MLSHMRTTIQLPDELYTDVRVVAAAEGRTVTSFIAEALRAALADREQGPAGTPYRVEPFEGTGLAPGVDLDDNAALLTLMDADAGP
ncbi:hypothetical protein BH20ACT5_BH20ACT5_03710 [soil metagenome]